MGAANKSSSEFSATEQLGTVNVQSLLLQKDEQCRVSRQPQDSTADAAALAELVARITHEFNNMLCVIMGYADIALQKRVAPDTNSDELIHIKEASERAAILARHLIASSEPHLEPSRRQGCVARSL